MLPLLLAGTGQIPLHLIFAAIAAQNMAMAEVRGSYSLRLAILSSGGMLLGIAAALGSMSSQYLWVALIVCGRHGGDRRAIATPQFRLRTAALSANSFHLLDGFGGCSGPCGGPFSCCFDLGWWGLGYRPANGSLAVSSAASASTRDGGVLAGGSESREHFQ